MTKTSDQEMLLEKPLEKSPIENDDDSCSLEEALPIDASHSDEFWVEMLKLQNKRLFDSRPRYGLRNFLGNDQRQQETRKADVRLIVEQVWRSYDDPKRMWMWSLTMFTAPALALVSLFGPKFGIVFALFTVSLWAAVHRVRRI